MNSNSIIISTVSKLLIPFALVFGIYVVVNGADSVGGGFQGGAVLSSVFILRYLSEPEKEIRLNILKLVEKVLMLMFLLLAIYIFTKSMNMGPEYGYLWMLLLNVIIAIKVSCGLSIVFFRYVFYEGR